MRLILLGPPGAGKGTQAFRLAARVGAPHVATGELLRAARAAETEIGARASEYMDAGELVPDEVVLEILKLRLAEPDASDGFVLDGFPRNAAQAKALDEILEEIGQKLDAVIALDVPDAVIVERLSSRLTCIKCGRVYSPSAPPKEPGRCNADGTELVRRRDDNPAVIQHRLQVYRKETEPLIAYYEDRGLLTHVNGVGGLEEVLDRMVASLPVA
ncbi:MAG: adenylate kinase [Actinomycetota bacterium]|nr:adenylate kinase [Actinomycetota bacterium]